MTQAISFGHYVLVGRLETGGMAEIYLARHRAIGERGGLLALKRILPHLCADADFVAMFHNEINITQRLHHPNIAQVYDHAQHEGRLFFVMEFVHGKDLAVIRDQAQKLQIDIPPSIVAYVGARIAAALHCAHSLTDADGRSQPILHRDISPQNIIVGFNGSPKLIDFGIAKVMSSASITESGKIRGKPNYVSPEQVRAEMIDARSDLFSLGAVMYEMLAGTPPFAADTPKETLERIAAGDIAPLEQVPAPLSSIILRSLQGPLHLRYPNALAMADALNEYLYRHDTGIDADMVAAFMQQLFSDDLLLENQRIHDLLHLPLPSETEVPAATKSSQPLAIFEDENTDVSTSSQILAASHKPDFPRHDTNTIARPVVHEEMLPSNSDLCAANFAELAPPEHVILLPESDMYNNADRQKELEDVTQDIPRPSLILQKLQRLATLWRK